MITYILPCAGLGTRLGLPYPKEIHRIRPGKSLIDFSLVHATSSIETTEKVVIVIAPGKEEVANYVEQSISDVAAVERVYFNEKYTEWPGSIHSAENHFGSRNVTLLPDSVLSTKKGELLAHKFEQEFDRGADLVFAYIEELDRKRLSNLGGLNVQNSEVIGFCDKPSIENPFEFNAFWAAFGFRGEIGEKVLEFMMQSVSRKKVDLASLELNVRAFPVETYIDLGTWPSISEYLQAEKLLE